MDILILQKPSVSLKLPLQHFVRGLTRVKFVLSETYPIEDSTIKKTFTTLLAALLLLYKKTKNQNRKSFIVESLPRNKWMTLNDKRIFSHPTILAISWLQTSVQELIGRGKVLKPFWNKRCLEISKRLWLPTGIDSVDSHSNLSNSSFVNQELNSWFTMRMLKNPQIKNLQRTSSPLSMFTPVKTWEEEGIRSRKIRIYPTNHQKQIFRNWIRTTTYVYNRALKALKTEKETKYNFQSLRNRFVTRKRITGKINPEVQKWETETPKHVRAGCLKDLVTAFDAAMTNLKRGNIRKFNLRYREKKSFPSIVLPKTSLKILNGKFYIYKTKFIKDEIKVSKDKTFQNLVEFNYDCRLKYKFGNWYLIVPMKVELPPKGASRLRRVNVQGTNKKDGICALDPGGRTFHTVFSETKVFKIQQDKKILNRLNEKLDFFKSLRFKPGWQRNLKPTRNGKPKPVWKKFLSKSH